MVINIPRICLVCSDLHRKEIEEYFLKVKSLKLTLQWAKDNYPDTRITYDSLSKHMRNHFVSIIEAGKQSSRLRQEVIKKDIYQDIQVSEVLSKNLKYLSDSVEEMKDKANTKEERDEILKFIGKVNNTVELIMKFKKDLDIENISTEEDLEKKILYCIQDFSVEDKELFLTRWKTYDSR